MQTQAITSARKLYNDDPTTKRGRVVAAHRRPRCVDGFRRLGPRVPVLGIDSPWVRADVPGFAGRLLLFAPMCSQEVWR